MLGLLVSGVLLEWVSWPSVFALNVVLAAVGMAMTLRFVPAGAPEAGARLDAGGATLSALGLAGVVWAFIEGPTRGWTSATVLGGFALGALLLVAFVLYELRAEEPMLDPRLFAQRGFAAGSLSIFVQFFALFGTIFVVLQYVQLVLRYTPLQAGAALAPAAVAMIAIAPRVPRLAERVGMRRVGPVGLVLIACGLTIAATMGVGASYWTLLAAVLVLGLGMALAAPPATAAIVTSLPDAQQGVASAVNDTAREVGGALGIAVLGSVLADHAGTIGPHTDPQALIDGYQAALHVGAAVLAAGAALVFARAPRGRGARDVSRSSSPARSSAPAPLG
jgi:MFS family permease